MPAEVASRQFSEQDRKIVLGSLLRSPNNEVATQLWLFDTAWAINQWNLPEAEGILRKIGSPRHLLAKPVTELSGAAFHPLTRRELPNFLWVCIGTPEDVTEALKRTGAAQEAERLETTAEAVNLSRLSQTGLLARYW